MPDVAVEAARIEAEEAKKARFEAPRIKAEEAKKAEKARVEVARIEAVIAIRHGRPPEKMRHNFI